MVSIVVPCYNCEKTFWRCVKSIQNQTQTNIEIVLVNNGSTDHTKQLCQEAAESDQRIKVFHLEPNRGILYARKTGVDNANGDYILFCDSDDYIDHNLVKNIEEKIALNKNVDILVYGAQAEYSDGTTKKTTNELNPGYYSYSEIQSIILPHFFSDGKNINSSILIGFITTKVIRRVLLVSVFQYLDFQQKIIIGEDIIISFPTLLYAHSLYCFENYYPYHYVENSLSMMHKKDICRLDGLIMMKNILEDIAHKYDYKYYEQINDFFLAAVLTEIKKQITRCEKKYKEKKHDLVNICENSVVSSVLNNCDISGYEWKSKIFAKLVKNKKYFVLYVLTKFMAKIGFGKP